MVPRRPLTNNPGSGRKGHEGAVIGVKATEVKDGVTRRLVGSGGIGQRSGSG